jgi:hypothetical protein
MAHSLASTSRLSRREWLRLSAAGLVGYSLSGWLEVLAATPAVQTQRRRACILLWMNGGPSQTDTFDLKPGHANGGPFKEIATSVPGIRISEHLPRLAKLMHQIVPVRSMSTKEGDHGRATYLLRTGYLPVGAIQYPSLGPLLAKEIGDPEAELPNVVSIAPYRFLSPTAFGPGFLGPQYAPLVVGDSGPGFNQQEPNNYEKALKVQDADLPAEVTREQADARLGILEGLQQDFLASHPGLSARSHRLAYERAVRLMRSSAARAFHLEDEPPAIRDAYGRNLFGQGCLLARRLVERGVPFVEVTLAGLNGNNIGWDTHGDNFNQVKRLSQVLDPAWATLMEELQLRGLLDSTLIVWMGEFGRTPKINENSGRDHYPNAWTTVLAGGGIKGGTVVGRTNAGGTTVEDRPVSVPDLLATVCMALGIDPLKQNMSNVGRPIRLADKSAKPIQEILA